MAAFYQAQLSSNVLDAEVLATALNVYATTQSLGGTAGRAYGFTVSAKDRRVIINNWRNVIKW